MDKFEMLLTQVEVMRDILVHRSDAELKDADRHRSDPYLFGLESGYASGYALSAEWLDDIIKRFKEKE